MKFISSLLFLILNFNLIYSAGSYPCSQELIIGDWGFWNLEAGQQSTWQLEPENVDISYVTSLEDVFADTTVYGFYGLKLSSLDDLSSSLTLNTTINLPETYDNFTGTYNLLMKISSTNGNIGVTINLDYFQMKKISSIGQLGQESINIPIQSGLMGASIPFSIVIQFYNFDTVYLDDIKIMAFPNASLYNNEKIYVSNEGSDLTGIGSFRNPFASVQQAILYLGDNSSIVVMPGYYCGMGNSWIDPSITSNNVKILAYSNENRPIFSGESLTNVISFQTWSENDLFLVDGLVFKDTNNKPNGALIQISGTEVTFFNCDFFQSSPTNQTIFLNYLNSSLFYNCAFYASTNGYLIQSQGVIGDAYLSIISSTFYSDSPLDILKIDYVSIQDSVFYSISDIISQCSIIVDLVKSFTVDNCFFEVTYCLIQSNMTVTNSSFANMDTHDLAIILLQDSNVIMDGCLFKNFSGDALIQAFHGVLTMNNCDVVDLYNDCIQVQSGSFYLTGSTISGPGNALNLDSTFSEIENCIFVDNYSFLILSQSTVELLGCFVYNSSAAGNSVFESTILSHNNQFTSSQNVVFQLSNSYYEDSNSSYYDNEFSNFIISKGSQIYLTGTKFYSNYYASAIILTDQSSINATNIYVANNYAEKGSFCTLQDSFDFNITDSIFINNIAYVQGGVIYCEGEGQILLNNVTASFNNAPQGGVFALVSENSFLYSHGGFYFNNTASEGSVVYYIGNTPSFIGNVTMKNNTDFNGSGDIALGKAYLTNTTVVPNSLQSGFNKINITFQLVDSNGNNLTNKTCTQNCQLYFFIAGVLLQTKAIQADGSCQFTNLVLMGPVGSHQPIIIYSNDETITPLKSYVAFDSCTPGYLPELDGQECGPCQSGTYGINGLNCSICPDNIDCLGGNQISAEVGYWMYFNISQGILEAYECPPDVCLANNQCAQNYEGPLCSECVEGAYNCGSGCKYTNSIDIIVVLVKLVIFIVLVLAQQLSSDSSGLIPIGLYFMQTLVVISSGVKFSILSILSGSSSSSTRTSSKDSVISYINDCIGPYGFYWNHYFVLSQPIILLIILSVIILIEFLMRATGILYRVPILKGFVDKSNREFRNRQFSAFIKICMNSYGPFITEMLLILFCTPVGQNDLLISNPGIQCVGNSYRFAIDVTWTLFPIVVLFPTIIFILLRKVRNRLDDKSVERKLGVFYLKYKPQFYFWDVLLLFKRFSIVILSMMEFESSVRSLSLVFLCLFYLFIQIRFRPFLSGKDNYLETISLTLLFISCIYLDNSLWAITGQWILIASIIIFIIAAIKLQGHYYWNEFTTKAQPIIQKIKHFFSCCFSEIQQRSKRTKKKLVDYNSEDSDDEEFSNDYTDESDLSSRYIGKVDQRNLLSNTFSTTYYDDE